MKQFIFAVASFLLTISFAIAADWPQFRGPTRDGKSPEKGLLKKWPEKGPKKLWSNSEIGHGWSGVAVVGGKVSVKRLWISKELDDYLGGMALVGNRLIGCCNELAKGLTAIDIRDGKRVYRNTKIGESSIIYADGLLYVQEHTGRMLLVDPADGKVISQFRIPPARSKKEKVWAHPGISDGKLYIRHDSTLSVFDISSKK